MSSATKVIAASKSFAVAKLNNRTDEPAQPPRARERFVNGAVIENRLFDVLCRAGRRAPSQIPRLNRAVTRLMAPAQRVDHSYRVFANTRSVRFTEMEWAIPRPACADMLSEIRSAITRHRFDVSFPIEVRFVAADDQSHLSPSYRRETAYLAVHMYRGMSWRPYFQAVQDIALAHDGRPHWGKRHMLGAPELAERYPAWNQFQAVRARLDPEGSFTNDHIRRVLGPVDTAARPQTRSARGSGR